MNLRILIYLNPSNINKISHKFELNGDSGFNLVKNSIIALNRIVNWHFYILVPDVDNVWADKPSNVTLVPYPYINDALNSRFHFDSNAINKYFNVYRHDIDLIWSMLPEHVSGLMGIANKRREEIPCFTYINWMDYVTSGYAPSYKIRMLDGIMNASAVGIQSTHMANTMDDILAGFEYNKDVISIIPPKTTGCYEMYPVGDIIGFPHRISVESGFKKMYNLIKDDLKFPMWVSNINGNSTIDDERINYEFMKTQEEMFDRIKELRFGVSYHVGYSMWSMSVIDMMSRGKVVLMPNKNAFPEMTPTGYPFLFNNKVEFVEKFNYLQTCPDEELLYWGKQCQDKVNSSFTWDIQAKQLSQLFYSIIGTGTTNKTENVYDVICDYNAISKTDLINKNITSFGRRCSRAWNKCRIELMRDYGIQDDITSEHTIFYNDIDRYLVNGIERVPSKKLTPYELRLQEQEVKGE